MNYEENLTKLQTLLEELKQDLPISQAVEKYQSAVGIIKENLDGLENIKGSITKIKQDLDSYFEEKMK